MTRKVLEELSPEECSQKYIAYIEHRRQRQKEAYQRRKQQDPNYLARKNESSLASYYRRKGQAGAVSPPAP